MLPGEELQIDFGTGAPVIGPDGKKRRPWMLRPALSCSRKAYSKVAYRQTTDNFISAIENAIDWLCRVNDAIESLDFMPTRCSLAPENRDATDTIYMLPADSHLILFSVDDDSQMENVVNFRAGRELPRRSLGK